MTHLDVRQFGSASGYRSHGSGERNKIYSKEGSGGASNWGNLGSRGSVGISPLIASVLTVLIAITVATIVIGWVTTVTKSTTRDVGNNTDKAIDCTVSQINIEEVYLDTTRNRSRVSVKNAGYTHDMVMSAVVSNSYGINAVNITEFPVILMQGDYATIEFNTTNTIPACGNFSRAVVSTKCKSTAFDSSPKNC